MTFHSPGTKHILYNHPSSRSNIELAYNLKEHIHTYLGTYANLVNLTKTMGTNNKNLLITRSIIKDMLIRFIAMVKLDHIIQHCTT